MIRPRGHRVVVRQVLSFQVVVHPVCDLRAHEVGLPQVGSP
ncbi:hypothetical protein [Rhodococcus tukisamuensis]|nr:hypothetical protein [Rhodococcus tukisamuensis]